MSATSGIATRIASFTAWAMRHPSRTLIFASTPACGSTYKSRPILRTRHWSVSGTLGTAAAIALTQTDPVFVLLSAGAPATQTVQVQVKNFNSLVPLVAVVTPEAGDRTTFNFDVDNTAGGATTGTVQVQIPAGVSTRIDVWMR